jgi:hypothetical protein
MKKHLTKKSQFAWNLSQQVLVNSHVYSQLHNWHTYSLQFLYGHAHGHWKHLTQFEESHETNKKKMFSNKQNRTSSSMSIGVHRVKNANCRHYDCVATYNRRHGVIFQARHNPIWILQKLMKAFFMNIYRVVYIFNTWKSYN